MDFDFVPSFNRQPGADLSVYGCRVNGTGTSGRKGKECAINCQFSRKVTEKLGWVRGDRVTAKWSEKDRALTFMRVGIDDPSPAYKVTFIPANKAKACARVRMGCSAEALSSIVPGSGRMVFSIFESNGNSAVFVAAE